MAKIQNILELITFNEQGLVPAIAQEKTSKKVLMLAWMNKEAIQKTLETGQVHYWSRSRKSLWRKGETSGHTQSLHSFKVDCDGDTILLEVSQIGPACHTGKDTCFFKNIDV